MSDTTTTPSDRRAPGIVAALMDMLTAHELARGEADLLLAGEEGAATRAGELAARLTDVVHDSGPAFPTILIVTPPLVGQPESVITPIKEEFA